MRIALYKQPLAEFSFVAEENTGIAMDYIRVSEIVEVEFPLLPPEITHESELVALQKKEDQVRKNYATRMKDIVEARARVNGPPRQP